MQILFMRKVLQTQVMTPPSGIISNYDVFHLCKFLQILIMQILFMYITFDQFYSQCPPSGIFFYHRDYCSYL